MFELMKTGVTHKGAGRREGGYSACAATADLWGQANVRFYIFLVFICIWALVLREWHGVFLGLGPRWTVQRDSRANRRRQFRADDKTAKEYNLEGGATLHLVLALRGGL